MGSKLKSFFSALGYLLIAGIIQGIVGFLVASTGGKKYRYDELVNIEQPNIVNIINESITSLNYILLISSIIIIIIFSLIYKAKDKKITNEILLKKTKSINIKISVLVGIFVWAFNFGIVTLLKLNGLIMEELQWLNEISNPLSKINIFFLILVIGIVVPFSEEFLFRGIVYKTLSKNITIPSTIIIQGILFGIFHGNLVQGFYTSLLGIILGFLTYKTQSLIPSIIAHMTNNIIAITIPVIMGKVFNNTVFIIFAIVGLIGIIITLFFINKNNPKVIEEKIKTMDEVYNFKE